MIEFLIKSSDGDWFEFPPGSDPYRPLTIPCRKVKGRGDGWIEIENCPISFSYEEPGIQVSFEGEMSEFKAAEVAEDVRQNIEKTSGQFARLIQIAK